MKVRLFATIENFSKKTMATIYIQEDQKYFVLVHPLNITKASLDNIHEYHNQTWEEVIEKVMPDGHSPAQ